MSEAYELRGIRAMQSALGGVVMDELKHRAPDFRVVQRRLAMLEEQKIAEFIDRVEVVAREATGGIRPDFEIPQRVLAAWEAKFKNDHIEKGGSEETWTPYAWWNERGRESWTTRFKKLNPHLVYKEKKRDNSIIVPASKYATV